MIKSLNESRYSRYADSYLHQKDYKCAISIPKNNVHLPSINELSSNQHFPSQLSLNRIVFGRVNCDIKNQEKTCHKNVQNPLFENKKQSNQMISQEIQINEPKIQLIQGNGYIYYHSNYENQMFSYYQSQFNPNEYENNVYTNNGINETFVPSFICNQNPDLIQINSIPTQISENKDSIYLNKPNDIYKTIENSAQFIFDPVELNFIPAEYWSKRMVSLEDLKKTFFCAKSSKHLRFEFKLWNALQITKHYPFLFSEIGVKWVAKSFIMVHRDIFGNLLQVTRPSAALFSSCGMFMTHGFRELLLSEVRNKLDPLEVSQIDESIIRLFVHNEYDFNENSGVADIGKIKWFNESRKKKSIIFIKQSKC